MLNVDIWYFLKPYHHSILKDNDVSFEHIRPNHTKFIKLSDKKYVFTLAKYKLCLWSNSMRLMINSGQ